MVYATPEDCKSELGKQMQCMRAERPDEWTMDDFIRGVEEMAEKVRELQHDLDRALERNTELLKEREWQPIETVPREGRVLVRDGDDMFLGEFEFMGTNTQDDLEGKEAYPVFSCDGGVEVAPDSWMLLSSPPEG